jgi:hypothetical protein
MKTKFYPGLKLILFFFFILGLSCTAFAEDKPQEAQGNFYNLCVSKEASKTAGELNSFLGKYFEAVSNHDIKTLSEMLADDYVSGDGYNRDKMIEIVKNTWNVSSDLKYSEEIKNIRFDDNFASIDFIEKILGTTNSESDITKDKGNIESISYNIIYLQKYGKGWKIVSDRVLNEETFIRFGKAKNIGIGISAPSQVPSGKAYTVSLQTQIPEGLFALGSITKQPLSYNQLKSEEIYRQIPGSYQPLERLLEANKDSLNEIAVGSISFCEVKKTVYTSPEIKLTGTAIILKRINVINKVTSLN